MKAPGVVAPSLFPFSPALLDSTRLNSTRLMQPRITRCFLHNLQCQKKKNSLSCLLLFFPPFFYPSLVFFCFHVPKSNYRRTNFYFFKSLGLCGRRRRGSARTYHFFMFYFLFFSSSTSSKDGSIHPSAFSTFWIFNSLFLISNLQRGVHRIFSGHQDVLVLRLHTATHPTHTIVSVLTFRCGSLTEQTGSGEMLS